MKDSNGNTVNIFLSTPSARRATIHSPSFVSPTINISIHALREEGDDVLQDVLEGHIFISIHALREEGDLLWRVLC